MSLLQKAQEYIREVRAETTKVSWPSRAEVRQATVVVLVAVALLTAVIFVMDRAFVFVIELLFS